VVEYCQREGIGFIPWFPMATGALARPGGPLQRMADDLGAAPSQLALAWLLQRSPVMLPIPGTSTVAHLEENVDAALIKLTPEQLRQLDTAT
jgi:pyridoxine 4-dehydrogenase